MLKTDEAFYNPFPHFGQSSVWPRGFPLEALPDPVSREYRTCRTLPPAVQQGLAAENPDVDAIFRLTRSTGLRQLELQFDSSSPPVLLPKGTYMPYNSQNTLFTSRAFWSLLLPISVSARVTDIYRAYWAQALLGLLGESVSIFPPTARHVRNVHSLTADLKEESVIYNTVFEYAKFLRQWKCSQVRKFLKLFKCSIFPNKFNYMQLILVFTSETHCVVLPYIIQLYYPQLK